MGALFSEAQVLEAQVLEARFLKAQFLEAQFLEAQFLEAQFLEGQFLEAQFPEQVPEERSASRTAVRYLGTNMPTQLPRKAAALEQSVEIETPEQVVFAYTIAGVGSRSAAALIDYAICIIVIIAILFLYSITSATLAPGVDIIPAADWMVALLAILAFVVFWGYYVLFEGLSDGQTPGKHAMGLRVVQDGGFSVSFAASAVRNLVRVIDMLPGVYAVGMFSVLLSKTGKRLGDHAAGTIVVQERAIRAPIAPAAEPAGDAAQAPLSAQLRDDEYSLLERYLARRPTLDPGRRAGFDTQILHRLGDRVPDSAQGQIDTIGESLSRLYAQEKALRARGVASRSDTGAAREQHSIVAAGAARWGGFAKTVAAARGRGLRKMSEDEVADLVAQYREVSTDLARLRTASRGRDSDAAYYLSRLVARGHNLLYKQRELVPLIVWTFLAITVPREVRRSWRYIGLAVLLFFVPMAVGHMVVVRHPGEAVRLVGPGMVDRAETARERERRGGGYLPQRMAEDRGPALASQLITNNVTVTYNAFALGITAGIGTAQVLLTNGVMIGAATGLFQSEGVLHLILAFMAPHGVLELSAICIAGGAGFLIGSAFLLPGALTRREALVVRGRRAIRLIAGASVLLVFAGIIEGFISPMHLPLPHAAAIGALTGVVMILYFMAGRGEEEGAPEEEFGYSDERALSSR